MPPVSPPGTAPALRAPPLRPLTASSAPSGLQPPLPAPATATDIVSLASPVHVEGRSLRLPLGPATVAHFTSNPLINVRSGGFFVPVDQDLALGTVLDVEIADGAGRPLLTGKGKVVAKQQLRIGVRLTEVDKEVLARLQGEVAKLAPRK
jgi:hypothetical protein